MKHFSTGQLLQFISDYKLRNGQVIIFNAIISYYKSSPVIKVSSEVQVITLPNELALYITEFYKEEYHIPEMYSTAVFDFRYSAGTALEIWDDTDFTHPLISILPVIESQ
ncbi:MAG: hypothetical protein ABI921_00720 [Panacibacter sp.]